MNFGKLSLFQVMCFLILLVATPISGVTVDKILERFSVIGIIGKIPNKDGIVVIRDHVKNKSLTLKGGSLLPGSSYRLQSIARNKVLISDGKKNISLPYGYKNPKSEDPLELAEGEPSLDHWPYSDIYRGKNFKIYRSTEFFPGPKYPLSDDLNDTELDQQDYAERDYVLDGETENYDQNPEENNPMGIYWRQKINRLRQEINGLPSNMFNKLQNKTDRSELNEDNSSQDSNQNVEDFEQDEFSY